MVSGPLSFSTIFLLLKETLVDVIVENGQITVVKDLGPILRQSLIAGFNRWGIAGVGAALCLSGGGSSGAWM